MSMEYSEKHSVFECSDCGNIIITGMDEQPPEKCEECDTAIDKEKSCCNCDNMSICKHYNMIRGISLQPGLPQFVLMALRGVFKELSLGCKFYKYKECNVKSACIMIY